MTRTNALSNGVYYASIYDNTEPVTELVNLLIWDIGASNSPWIKETMNNFSQYITIFPHRGQRVGALMQADIHNSWEMDLTY
jgi:hypothetical protein